MIPPSRVWSSSLPKASDLKLTPEELYSAARPVLEAGRAVSFHASGGSMCPFLRDGAEVRLIAAPVYRRGDVVLCRTVDGRVVLHYIIKVEAETCTLMGAANLMQTELCHRVDIIGKMISPAVGRRGVILWHCLLPVRRYLMWIYRKIYGC